MSGRGVHKEEGSFVLYRQRPVTPDLNGENISLWCTVLRASASIQDDHKTTTSQPIRACVRSVARL